MASPSETDEQRFSHHFRYILGNMAAGGIAGSSVETALFPLDTIKTRLQRMLQETFVLPRRQPQRSLWGRKFTSDKLMSPVSGRVRGEGGVMVRRGGFGEGSLGRGAEDVTRNFRSTETAASAQPVGKTTHL
ncbi:hypothetical protein CYMTET_15304 [Cymbomonas tetramitiformis]|uniref:Uncharacterized protein n=1 Tax=Cymbomonas tetramitiformis TaxID=36881 RepID=A0AAE0GEI2_9CHLO|nr:hypothetical protein CYMTET_15304 [Cymbomonas tetramitiformis]